MVAFTKALYYPNIDVSNECWLKNAMLYWSEIYTIVPRSECKGSPYNNPTSKEFYEQQLLKPYYVYDQHPVVRAQYDTVKKYLDSTIGYDMIHKNVNGGVINQSTADVLEPLYQSRFSTDAQKLLSAFYDKYYKFMNLVHKQTSSFGQTASHETIWVNKSFAHLYMTSLATAIADDSGFGLLTNKSSNENLANVFKFDTYSKETFSGSNIGLAQGCLANVTLNAFEISADTPVKKIIEFRDDHISELGKFREEIAKLSEQINTEKSPEAIRQNIEDIYLNKIKPATIDLKQDLTDNKIEWVTNNGLSIASLAVTPGSALALALGLNPITLLAIAGITITVAAIKYNLDKKKSLKQNPYSYLLSIDKDF